MLDVFSKPSFVCGVDVIKYRASEKKVHLCRDIISIIPSINNYCILRIKYYACYDFGGIHKFIEPYLIGNVPEEWS